MGWWGYAYVSAAEKRRKRERAVARLEKKHGPLSPVVIPGRAVSSTFWGKAWCRHFEGMADFENRLPRGRTYARNGSVVHLELGPGSVKALVSGTSLYQVKMDVLPLPEKKWGEIKRAAAGRIGNIIDLLAGRFPKDVMDIVCDPEKGLFPLASEISFSCSCPDWARLCKHVGAVFYGVANRLDASPELLFALRGADPAELLSVESMVGADSAGPDDIDEADLSSIFGVEISGGGGDEAPARPGGGEGEKPRRGPGRPPKAAAAPARAPRASGDEAPARPGGGEGEKPRRSPGRPAKAAAAPARAPRASAASGAAAPAAAKPPRRRLDFNTISGSDLDRLRLERGLTFAELGRAIGVSYPTIVRWVETRGPLKMRWKSQELIRRWSEKAS
jgi:hypothetical protein